MYTLLYSMIYTIIYYRYVISNNKTIPNKDFKFVKQIVYSFHVCKRYFIFLTVPPHPRKLYSNSYMFIYRKINCDKLLIQ